MKNEKLYKERRDYAQWYSSYDYLNREERSELYHDVKNRSKQENCHVLEGSNNQASVRVDVIDNVFYTYLTSYYTDVAVIIYGKFHRIWDGYSATTLRHINLFRQEYGFEPISKYDWIMMDCL